jgi:5'-deoxynucleotidase YfbR-like HD superfamily hydrolase
MLEKILKLREGGAVRRYHTARTNRVQTVADHSHGVACLLCILVSNPRSQLLQAALYHDMAECVTGDAPATAKWKSPALSIALEDMEGDFAAFYGLAQALSAEECRMLKIADLLELVIWNIEDFRMGNEYAGDIVRRGLDYLDKKDLAHGLESVQQFINHVKALWSEAQ